MTNSNSWHILREVLHNPSFLTWTSCYKHCICQHLCVCVCVCVCVCPVTFMVERWSVVTVTKLYSVWLGGRSLYFCHSKQCNFTVLFFSAPQPVMDLSFRIVSALTVHTHTHAHTRTRTRTRTRAHTHTHTHGIKFNQTWSTHMWSTRTDCHLHLTRISKLSLNKTTKVTWGWDNNEIMPSVSITPTYNPTDKTCNLWSQGINVL